MFVDEPVVVRKLAGNEVDERYAGGSAYWGTNAKCLGSRLRQIGWNPKRADVVKYLDQRIGFEIEEQELEAEERRPSYSPDNSSVMQTNIENTTNENNPFARVSM